MMCEFDTILFSRDHDEGVTRPWKVICVCLIHSPRFAAVIARRLRYVLYKDDEDLDGFVSKTGDDDQTGLTGLTDG